MKKIFLAASVLLSAVIMLANLSYAAIDNGYQLSEISSSWDGTDGSRLKAPSADYDYTYGDESSVTYTLPWSFTFYGQSYSHITADTNGNIWFTSTGSAIRTTLPPPAVVLSSPPGTTTFPPIFTAASSFSTRPTPNGW